MSCAEYPEFEEYQQRWSGISSDLGTTSISILLGAVIGAYILTRSLDFCGYPVWLRMHQLLDMSMDVLSLRRASSLSQPPDADSSDDETMQRGGMFGSLFGTSPGSLLQKGMRGVASAFSTGPSEVPPGLGNLSNSCYQNSVIQGLASLPSLRDYLSKTTSEHASLSPESTNGALFDIITKLNDPENKGSHFWIRGKLKSMSTWEQQDAQEYYSKILDALDEEVKKTASSKRRSSVSWLEVARSLSDSRDTGDDAQGESKDEAEKTGTSPEQVKTTPNPLEGRLAQRVGCTTCGYSEGLTLIPFNCITVSLGRNYSYDIRECLDEYTTLEFIDGVECAKCTLLKMEKTMLPLVANNPDSPLKDKLVAVQSALEKEDFEDKTLLKTFNILKKNWVQSTKSKQAVVARPPQSLVLHVNRSSFNEHTGMPYKNTAGVNYPTVLDLGNWCLGSTPSDSKQPQQSEEEWPRDPRESMLAGGEPTTNSPFQYRLRAAVTHYGSHGNGHYVCYRPHPKPAPKPKESPEEPQTPTAEEDDRNSEDLLAPAPEESETTQGEQWWRFSDDSVYAVSEDDAHQGNVFMLFYERIDDTVSTSQLTQTRAESSAVAEEAPLPPADMAAPSPITVDDEAVAVALPDDEDDLFDVIPPVDGPATSPEAIQPPLSIEEPAQQDPDTEMSEADSEDGGSTQVTDYESEDGAPTQALVAHTSHNFYRRPPGSTMSVTEADMPTPPNSVPVPQMRTAGHTATGGTDTQSLPLVSAT
jgi:ubiquitin carboxyl-terminal hydrolase 1